MFFFGIVTAAGAVALSVRVAVLESPLASRPARGDRVSAEKIFLREKLVARRAVWKQEDLRVVFTNGCFDLLHAAHVRLLEKARATSFSRRKIFSAIFSAPTGKARRASAFGTG